jgi:hypothetical protein
VEFLLPRHAPFCLGKKQAIMYCDTDWAKCICTNCRLSSAWKRERERELSSLKHNSERACLSVTDMVHKLFSFSSPVVTICTTSLTFKTLRSAHTVYLCVLCGSENKQRLFHCTALTDWLVLERSSLSHVTLHTLGE